MSSPLSKSEKEKQKMIQDKCQTILASMLRDEDNKYCVDCDAKGPRWASWNLGIFLCIRCAGIHRNLGVHISRVKSVNLDSWTPEQVTSLQQMGNSRARAVYEANLPDSFRRPQTDSTLETFIRAKYETKKYIAKEWVCPPPLKVSWDAEIELELKRKKEAKRKVLGGPGSPASNPVELPTPSVARSRPTESTNSSPAGSLKEISMPTPVELPPPSKASSAADDLLGLDTLVSAPASNDLFGGLLGSGSGAVPANGNVPNAAAPSKNADEDSFFNQTAPSTAEKKTLDKNSILALYNQGGSSTASTAPNPAAPLQNMFSMPGNLYQPQATNFQPQTGFGAQPTAINPMMGGNYNPLVQGNMFSSPIFPTNGQAAGVPLTVAAPPPMAQLSQQLSGLNFGPAPTGHNPMMPAGAALVPGIMMMNNSAPMMAANPSVGANMNPYMYQPAGQQQTTLSTNLWQ